MKWMMWSVALMVAMVLPVAVGAQSGTKANGDKTDKKAMKDSTYTGCLEAGSASDTFMLTDVVADYTGKDTTKKTAKKKGTVVPTTMALTSASVDLSAHLGHTVSVTGSTAMAKSAPAFPVESLKMVAVSCS
jgi:hypothetical protein